MADPTAYCLINVLLAVSLPLLIWDIPRPSSSVILSASMVVLLISFRENKVALRITNVQGTYSQLASAEAPFNPLRPIFHTTQKMLLS